MRNEFEDWTFYESTFDTDTGTLVRVTEEPDESPWGHLLDTHPSYSRRAWRKKYGSRNLAFSPVPETIDIKITSACGFGCEYCYMGSTPKGLHAPIKLVETVLDGLDTPPYQIALGGGEPTLHPELPKILQLIRHNGTVPNFTTAGHHLRQDVFDATNEYAGGVALTYHSHKGIDWFLNTYKKWKAALSPRVQLNVHVMADKDGADNLRDLCLAFDNDQDLTPSELNVVLLAYHPGIGRAKLDRIMPKKDYMHIFPGTIQVAMGMGVKIAFSEGLLPFFLSRPELNVDLTYAMALEGRFTCYVDDRGFVANSSFTPYTPYDELDEEAKEWRKNWDEENSIYHSRLQDLWNRGQWYRSSPNGGPCYDCRLYNSCADSHVTLMFMCKYQNINNPTAPPPLTDRAKEQRAFWAEIEADKAQMAEDPRYNK
jgi:MoaA/NifB/PqqE/SkfB family radical SAM enzyme